MSTVTTTPVPPRRPSAPSRVRSVLRGSAVVLGWLVILALGAAVLAAVLVPRLAGATPYTILTGSMQPGLPPGTLVVVRPVRSPADIHPGVVITYQLRSGEPEVVTHRVIAQHSTLTGATEYQTQGDANDTPDAALVRPAQVRGTLWYAVPLLGRANTLLDGPEHQVVVYVAAALLALYGGSMFAGAARQRRTRGRGRR